MFFHSRTGLFLFISPLCRLSLSKLFLTWLEWKNPSANNLEILTILSSSSAKEKKRQKNLIFGFVASSIFTKACHFLILIFLNIDVYIYSVIFLFLL